MLISQNPELVTREILWNIPTPLRGLMYGLFVVAAVCCIIGIWRRVRIIRIGLAESNDNGANQPGDSKPGFRAGLGRLWSHGILQVKIWRSTSAGLSHTWLFWSFIVLTIVTLIVAVEDYHIPHLFMGHGIFHGTFYLIVSLAADLFILGQALNAEE